MESFYLSLTKILVIACIIGGIVILIASFSAFLAIGVGGAGVLYGGVQACKNYIVSLKHNIVDSNRDK